MLCSNEAFFILAGGGGERMSLVLISNTVVLHP